MKLCRTRIILAMLLGVLATASGCGVINGIRAKNQLNEGVRAYRAGRFAEAQQHFEQALTYDPDNKLAPSFIARSIHAQFRPSVESPENLAKGRAAIEAYQKVLAADPTNDEAYNAVAALYGSLKDDNQQREWIMQRANLESAPPEKRSEAFTVLASKQWNCSYTITEQPQVKKTVQKEGKAFFEYVKPKEQKDFDQARACVQEGMRLVDEALKLNSENESAWSYKTNLLREMAKLAQMEGKADEKARYDEEANRAQERLTALSEQNKQKKEAAQQSSPAPAS